MDSSYRGTVGNSDHLYLSISFCVSIYLVNIVLFYRLQATLECRCEDREVGGATGNVCARQLLAVDVPATFLLMVPGEVEPGFTTPSFLFGSPEKGDIATIRT